MKYPLNALHPYELEALLDALRRDMRTQKDLVVHDPQWADWHRSNARIVCRLLEAINPKSGFGPIVFVRTSPASQEEMKAVPAAAGTATIGAPQFL